MILIELHRSALFLIVLSHCLKLQGLDLLPDYCFSCHKNVYQIGDKSAKTIVWFI